MKKAAKTSSIPGKTLWLEKLNTIIERDIALVILIMLIGLIYSDQWYTRGFPFTWLLTGSALKHSVIITDHFVMDLIIAIIFVAAGEVITSAVRRINEPVAFVNRGSSPSYANIFDDTESSGNIQSRAGEAVSSKFKGMAKSPAVRRPEAGNEVATAVKSFITMFFIASMIFIAVFFTMVKHH